MNRINKKRKRFNYELIVDRRLVTLLVIVLLSFSILGIKLFNVMISMNKDYEEELASLTDNKVLGSSAPRGRIFDRNYNVIVDNKAINSIVYKKEKGTSIKEMIDLSYEVSKYIDLDYKRLSKRNKKEFYLVKYPDKCNKLVNDKEKDMVIQRKISSHDLEELKIKRITDKMLDSFNEEDNKAAYLYYLMNKGYLYSEKIIKSEASDKEFAYISENNSKLKGFNTRVDWERVYPYGDTLRSVLGTVSTSSQGLPKDEVDEYLDKGYALNDRVGLSYIEKQYEDVLKGKKAVYEVVNSHELKLIKEGKRGNDIVLSIDINLQREIEDIITRNIYRAKSEANTEYYDHSSVIITEPNTGEILAMASKKIVNGKIVDNVIGMLMLPVTPGSIVKGASMLVGYNTGSIKIGEYMVDECIKIKGTKEKCSSKTLGYINDITALAKSSNVYQFKAAIRVNGQEYYRNMKMNFNQNSFDTYRKMYRSFGLGASTGIDLPTESFGYTSKDKAAGNLLDYVMGQYETYTPIQISQYINTISNGGTRYSLHLLKEVRKSSESSKLSEEKEEYKPKVLNTVETSEEYMKRMQQGFYAVMHQSGAYGRGYMEDKLDGAGKTGTSQSFIDKDGDGLIDTETITSSFVGYAPFNNPKFSITVISPNSSRPNESYDYASLVTMRISREITNKYYDMYGL